MKKVVLVITFLLINAYSSISVADSIFKRFKDYIDRQDQQLQSQINNIDSKASMNAQKSMCNICWYIRIKDP